MDMSFKVENKKTKGAVRVQVFFLEATDQYLGRLSPACCLMPGLIW
jgi:hypothetical protein